MTFYHQQVEKIKEALFANESQIQQVVQAKHFMDSQFGEVIDLKDISDSSFFSKFHFVRIFKKYYGRTPYQYLTEVRMAKAKQLLQSGMTVSGTCSALGFASVTSFTGLFKRTNGTTPSEFIGKNKTKFTNQKKGKNEDKTYECNG